MVSKEDKEALKNPCHRLFYISSEELGRQVSSSWKETQREIDAHIDDVLQYYHADYITYHNYIASGIANVKEPESIVEGLSCEKREIDKADIWIRTPDVRHEIGKTLRADLRKINSLRETAPEFGPYCVTGLGFADQKTMSMSEDNSGVVMQVTFAGRIEETGQLLLSIPVGGADNLAAPEMSDGFREITQEQYLNIVYAGE